MSTEERADSKAGETRAGDTKAAEHKAAESKGAESKGAESKGADARTEVLQGTLDLMILQTLHSLGSQHGYAIAARLEQISGGALQLNMGTLYPGLTRLEARNWIKATWAQTPAGRRARFYALTARGRKQLDTEKAQWLRMAGIMTRLLEGRG
jgi:PadR family transcriptional regulator PadR